MKLVFHGLERPIELLAGQPSVLQIENSALFARVCLSLLSGEGRFALEPYTIWQEDSELKPKDSLMVISDMLNLPWDDRAFMATVIKQMEREFLEDEELRGKMEAAEAFLRERLDSLDMGFNADYEFALQWDLKRYLKYLGFGASYCPDKSLLDNLLNFLSLALDSGCKRVLVFVNLKNFLTETELEVLYEHVFYSKLAVLLLENKVDDNVYEYEIKHVVDQHFIES